MAKLLQNCIYSHHRRNFVPVVSNRNFFFWRKNKIPEERYRIDRPKPEDSHEILNLLWKYYFINNPCIRSLGLGHRRNPILDEYVCNILHKGLSLIVRCKHDGCIIGVALNNSVGPCEPELRERFACTLKDKQMASLFMFWAHLEKTPRLWNQFCTLNVFEVAHVCIKLDDRGHGLATKLTKESLSLGADTGFPVMRVIATSDYCSKMCEKLNLKLIHEIPYCSYMSPHNDIIFKIPAPDLAAKTYIYTPKMDLNTKK